MKYEKRNLSVPSKSKLYLHYYTPFYKYKLFPSDYRYYILDVLWCQQIKLIQVVSTSEFHEY
jgi:hypothetical protein